MPDALDRCRVLWQPHQHAGPPQGFCARVHRRTAYWNRGQLLDAPHNLDLVTVGFRETDALTSAGLVNILDPRGPGPLRYLVQILFARGVVGDPNEAGIALLRHVDVM